MDALLAILIPALIQVESGGDPNAIGDDGAAVGVLQLHRHYVDDVNRIVGQPLFHYDDRLDPILARSMTYIYLRYWGGQHAVRDKTPPSLEALARIHKGGPRGATRDGTRPYWDKVRQQLRCPAPSD